MQVGDLVVKKGEWAKHNAWMTGTFLDDGDKKTYGIIIANRFSSAFKVAWLSGSYDWHEREALEVVCK